MNTEIELYERPENNKFPRKHSKIEIICEILKKTEIILLSSEENNVGASSREIHSTTGHHDKETCWQNISSHKLKKGFKENFETENEEDTVVVP